MKILFAKFFQAISIEGNTTSGLENGVGGYSLTEDARGIWVRKNSACTFTTWSNVQYVKYDESVPTEAKKTK